MCRLGQEFVGWGPVFSVRDPTEKKNWTPKIEKNENLFFVALPTGLFLLKLEGFWPLVPPTGAVRTTKT